MGKPIKYPVSERALIQRLNRKLAQDDRRIKKTRGRSWSTLGDYYILDTDPNRNMIVEHHLSLDDLVKMAREDGVMAEHEKLEEEQ